jgi:predicted permease
VKYAARSLRRTPGFTVAALVTLALGIGANTAIFSLVEAVMLRTLPIRAPERLQFIAHGEGDDVSMSSNFGWYERVQQETSIFEGVAAYNTRSFKIAGDDGVEQVVGQYASGNYHVLLGVPIALGRGFASERDRAAGSSPYAVISDAYWARRFGRSPDVIGRALSVGGHRVTIVGVTAAGFEGLSPGRVVEVTLPLSIRIADEPDFVSATDSWTSMPLVGRLRAGVPPAAAQAAIAAAYKEYVSRPEMRGFGASHTGRLLPAARGADRLRREYGLPLRVLIAMVGIVLIIACVNVANLLLVRGAGRAREVALRMAIGANRRRVLRQLLTEACLLALCGGVLGFLIAAWVTPLVTGLLAAGQDPLVISATVNWPVLLFAATLSLITGVAYGLAPAFFATRVDLNTTLKNGGPRGRRQTGRQVLVAAQLALSLVLLCGSVLLVRTLGNLRAVDAGIATEHVVMFGLDAFDTPLAEEQMVPLCTAMLDRLRVKLGVVQASCSTSTPVDDGFDIATLGVPTPPAVPDADDVYTNDVTPEYFGALGIELIRGRAFGGSDVAGAPLVAIVNETFARFYFPGQDALGQTISFGRRGPVRPLTIVGIARDAMLNLRSAAPRMAYRPLAQTAQVPRQLTVAARTAIGPEAIALNVRSDVRELSRDVAVTYVRSMEQQIGAALVTERLLATLLTAFAGLALLLACVGVYGVTSFDVTRRTRDIGIRIALGASRHRVLSSILGQTAAIAGVGIATGLAIAAAASVVLSRFLFGIEPRDPVTFALGGAILAVTALIAGYMPAHRASRVDPTVALRAE